MSDPRVSIIIPCFNHGHYLTEAIANVEALKSTTAHEVIIVNDGSTDAHTLTVLNALAQRGYRVIHQENAGLGPARNTAIRHARGEYLLPLDCDNKLTDVYLTRGVAILDSNPNVEVVYGDSCLFGLKTGRQQIREFDLMRILRMNYIDACALYRRSAWSRVGGYESGMPHMGNEDWELWVHIALTGGTFVHIDDVCFYYRTTADQMSVTTTRPGYLPNKEYILRKHQRAILKTVLRSGRIRDYVKHHGRRALPRLIFSVLRSSAAARQ